MASKAHQIISGLLAKKMREKGYEVVSYDGDDRLISNIVLKTPPAIKKHRPDLVGINPQTNKLCIGEAKTKFDLYSARTKEQLIDFSGIIANDTQSVELIIGIPKSAESALVNLLKRVGVHNNPNVSYIWVPDELLGEEIENEEDI